MSVAATWRDRARSGGDPAPNTQAGCVDAPQRPQTRNRRAQAKALECLTCDARYSREDVLSGLYRIETKVCGACYGRMQAAPHAMSCFGKPRITILMDGTRQFGYDPEARECRELCHDAKLCAAVADPASYNPPE